MLQHHDFKQQPDLFRGQAQPSLPRLSQHKPLIVFQEPTIKRTTKAGSVHSQIESSEGTAAGKQKYMCPLDEGHKEVGTAKDFKAHIKNQHFLRTRFLCPHEGCKLLLPNERPFRAHLGKKHNGSAKFQPSDHRIFLDEFDAFGCGFCGQYFSQLKDLSEDIVKHVEEHMASGRQEFRRWNPSLELYGLLHNEAVREAWLRITVRFNFATNCMRDTARGERECITAWPSLAQLSTLDIVRMTSAIYNGIPSNHPAEDTICREIFYLGNPKCRPAPRDGEDLDFTNFLISDPPRWTTIPQQMASDPVMVTTGVSGTGPAHPGVPSHDEKHAAEDDRLPTAWQGISIDQSSFDEPQLASTMQSLVSASPVLPETAYEAYWTPNINGSNRSSLLPAYSNIYVPPTSSADFTLPRGTYVQSIRSGEPSITDTTGQDATFSTPAEHVEQPRSMDGPVDPQTLNASLEGFLSLQGQPSADHDVIQAYDSSDDALGDQTPGPNVMDMDFSLDQHFRDQYMVFEERADSPQSLPVMGNDNAVDDIFFLDAEDMDTSYMFDQSQDLEMDMGLASDRTDSDSTVQGNNNPLAMGDPQRQIQHQQSLERFYTTEPTICADLLAPPTVATSTTPTQARSLSQGMEGHVITLSGGQRTIQSFGSMSSTASLPPSKKLKRVHEAFNSVKRLSDSFTKKLSRMTDAASR